MSIQVWAVYRAKIFSHLAIDADRAILEESVKEFSQLCSDQVEVTSIDEEDFLNFPNKNLPKLILTMAQGPEVLKKIQLLENNHVCVINNSKSIVNCFRENLVRKMQLIKDSAFIRGEIINTKDLSQKDVNHWIKRGDFHATENEDVLFVRNAEQLEKTKKDFLKRNILNVIKQPHLPGKIIKFYGVKNKILNIRDLGISGFDRYNLEKNTESFELDLAKVESRLMPIIEVLRLDVYGGDLVLQDNGDFQFIDINDWPSFRTCRSVAAKHIAKLAKDRLGI